MSRRVHCWEWICSWLAEMVVSHAQNNHNITVIMSCHAISWLPAIIQLNNQWLSEHWHHQTWKPHFSLSRTLALSRSRLVGPCQLKHSRIWGTVVSLNMRIFCVLLTVAFNSTLFLSTFRALTTTSPGSLCRPVRIPQMSSITKIIQTSGLQSLNRYHLIKTEE
mgnify:CR=1 FL=1